MAETTRPAAPRLYPLRQFDKALAPTIEDLGQWETHDQRARTITPHDSLPAAMHHDRTQAFLRLRGRDGGTVGPLIQYLHTSVVTTDEAVLAATGGRYRATAERPEAMPPGRLAFTWFPDDEADCVRRDFVVLAGVAWKALQAVTSPHVETAAGSPLRRYGLGRQRRHGRSTNRVFFCTTPRYA